MQNRKNEERKNEWRTGCEKIKKKKYNSENREAKSKENKIENK